MSLDSLDATLDAIRAEATQAYASYTHAKEQLSADRMTSDEGKRVRSAALHQEHKARMEGLCTREDNLVDSKFDELTKRLAGSSGSDATSIIAFRDAQDRADALDEPEAAGRLMDRALATDDRSLASAIMRRALHAGWDNVADKFLSRNSSVVETVKDLQTLSNFRNNLNATFLKHSIYAVLD
jgi:hypothetical protein